MNDKIDVIRLWIEKADHDLGTAELIYRHIPKYRETIAFHCQQAVEKYLKGYLIFNDLTVKRTHDLVLLLGMISQTETIPDELFDQAAELLDYSVEVRYPDTIIDLTNEDVERAISIGRYFREVLVSKMNLGMVQDLL
jgi:HEPN domain-containing protein